MSDNVNKIKARIAKANLGMFSTPDSADDLMDYCDNHNGAERTISTTSAMMGFNLGLKAAIDIIEAAEGKPDSNMTASGYAKSKGMTSLNEVAEMTGTSRETLNNWFNSETKRGLFEIVVLGCSVNNVLCD